MPKFGPSWIGPGNFGNFYSPDPPHPAIVVAAKSGDLKKVRQLLKKDPAKVNACREREEVEEKYGYDKSWTWNDDSPLVAAAREGHHLVVLEVLLAGANVAHNSCPSDDVHETAKQAVENRLAKRNNPAALTQKYEAILQLLEVGEQHQAALKAPEVGGMEKKPASNNYFHVLRKDDDSVLGEPPVKKTVGEMKVVELKDVLRNVGLPCTGLRWQLVERLTETYPNAIRDNHKLQQKKYEERKEKAEKAAAEKEKGKEAAVKALREIVLAAGLGEVEPDALENLGGNGQGQAKRGGSGAAPAAKRQKK
eukprot:g1013.t1